MTDIVRFNQVEDKIIVLRDQNVILDSDVAALYGVQTKEINQAVRNNPDKFPSGYVLDVDNKELARLRSKFLTANLSPKSRVMPKAFNEKGLYMLATILKGKKATQTTLEIIETFTKIRQLQRVVAALPETTDKTEQKSLLQRGADIMTDLLDEEMHTTGSETTIELNLAMLKVKHTVKREK